MELYKISLHKSSLMRKCNRNVLKTPKISLLLEWVFNQQPHSKVQIGELTMLLPVWGQGEEQASVNRLRRPSGTIDCGGQ